MRPTETIITDIESKLTMVSYFKDDISNLVDELKNAPKEAWDWVSVKKASEIIDVSVATVYARVNAGRLTARHIESKTFVKLSEVMAIDDK